MHIYQDEADAFLKAVEDMKYVWVAHQNPRPDPLSRISPISIDGENCSIDQYPKDSPAKRKFEDDEIRGILIKNSQKKVCAGSVQVGENKWLIFSNTENIRGMHITNLQRESAHLELQKITVPIPT